MAPGASENTGIGRAIGDIEHKTIQGHEPQPSIESFWSAGGGLQFDHLRHQVLQRRHTKSLPGLTQSRTSRRFLGSKRLQPFEHLTMAVSTKQAQSDHEPNDEPGRQSQVTSAGMAGAPENPLDFGLGNDTLQGTQSLRRRKLCQSGSIHAPSMHRSLLAR